MERRERVKELLKQGILVSPEELDNYGESKNSITIEEHVSKLRRERGLLERELLRKIEPVSINKITLQGNTSIIGLVRECEEGGFTLQDSTGEIRVASSEKAEPGNMVGATGFLRNGSFVAESIVWPDVPLQRKTKTIPPITFTAKPGLQGSATPIQNSPHYIKLGEASILVSRNKASQEDAVEMLKRRMIAPHFIISEIPDFFWIEGNDENWARNYKGVVILSTKKEASAIYENGKAEIFKSASQN